MPTTLEVATDRQDRPDDIVTPREHARSYYVTNPPGAAALKLVLHLINTAGGRMADDVEHSTRLADIKAIEGIRDLTRREAEDLFAELAGAVLVFDDQKTRCSMISGFLAEATLNHRQEETGDILITWKFGKAFRNIADQSAHWAIIDRQTAFALRSRYSISLFQRICSYVKLDKQTSMTFTVDELREILGVPSGTMTRFSHLKLRAIEAAIEEINQKSRFHLTATYHKRGRTVASVTIAWSVNPPAANRALKVELDRHSAGRKHRLAGTAEHVAERLTFPASGGVRFGLWQEKHQEANQGRSREKVKDINLTADAFRSWMTRKGIPFDQKNIADIWLKFCKGDSL